MFDRAHGQRVEANDLPATTQDVGGSRTRGGGGPRGLPEPLVECSNAASEGSHLVAVVKALDRTERLATQRAGMGLGFST